MTAERRIHYRIVPIDPAAHLFEVHLELSAMPDSATLLSLPAWIPGSYMIRDFARNIVTIEADDGARAIRIDKVDKHRWSLRPRHGRARVRYQVYAWDLSVRGAHLDDTHAFFNGTSVFLRVDGSEHLGCTVRIEPPPGIRGWRVATSLPRLRAKPWGFGDYQASDYDALIDHPVEMGRFELASFEAAGARHDVVVTGQHDGDLARFTRDLKPICEAQARLFDARHGRAPFERYLFLLTVVGSGYGGLEHRTSTALIADRNDMPRPGLKAPDEGYRRLLGLASHEYFHIWNIKRIKPAAFVPYRLDAESHTRLLWVFEGFTSYYDDLMLHRAGRIDTGSYLGLIGETIGRVLAGPGRHVQSVAESSFDAWTKFYRQDENAGNAIVSYYAKGALIALALDLTIRQRTGAKRSLDDLMRLMWDEFGRDFPTRPRGIAEDAMPGLIQRATGLDLRGPIASWVHGTTEMPLARLLARHGVTLSLEAVGDGAPWLGLRSNEQAGGLQIAAVVRDGPAHHAGLAAGDQLVAIDGIRVADARTLTSLLARKRSGEALRIHAFRGDLLSERMLILATAPSTRARVTRIPRPSASARRLRDAWLALPARGRAGKQGA